MKCNARKSCTVANDFCSLHANSPDLFSATAPTSPVDCHLTALPLHMRNKNPSMKVSTRGHVCKLDSLKPCYAAVMYFLQPPCIGDTPEGSLSQDDTSMGVLDLEALQGE